MGKGKMAVSMSADQTELIRTLDAQQHKLSSLEGNYRKLQRTTKTASKATEEGFGSQAAGTLARYATGVLSVGTALTTASRAYTTWMGNIREGSAEVRKQANELVAFAALQEGGTKAERVQQAQDLAIRYGIADRGMAFDVVQALQSARGGDFQKGLQAAEVVFAGTQVGIPVEMGKELEVLGATQGQAVGQAERRAFVAGQLSGRDPATIARAGSAMQFWRDKDMGYAAASILAGSVKEQELQTYVKAGGVGLSGVSSLAPYWEEHGLKEATRRQRLQFLKERGIDTPEEFKEIGLGEIRQQQALATLVQNLPAVEFNAAEINRLAKPGLLARQRAGVERELPQTTVARHQDIIESAWGDQLASETDSQVIEREQKIRGLAYRRAGRRSMWGGVDVQDEQGRTSMAKGFFAQLYWFVMQAADGTQPFRAGGPFQVAAEKEAIRVELSETDRALLEGPGGKTLDKPDHDPGGPPAE